MPRTSAFTGSIVRKKMPVERSLSVVLNVSPDQPVTRPVLTLKGSTVTVWTMPLTYVMDAARR